MNKKLLLLPTLLLMSSLSSCGGSNKVELSYGSIIDTQFTEIDYATLSSKLDEEENMLLVVYPGADSTCSCWIQFKYVINEYVSEHKPIIYGIDAFEITGKPDTFNLVLSLSSPTLNIIKDGQIKEVFQYSTKNTQKFFKNSLDLSKLIDEYCDEPELIYINEQHLDNLIENEQDDYMVMYYYHSCPDCAYCLPNVVLPYMKQNEINTPFYLVNLEVEGIMIKDGVVDKTSKQYLDFKKNHYLSDELNKQFGYDQGVVPTFQYWSNKTLASMSVYFNDTISKIDGKYIITNSYYSNERINNLEYTNTVLEGMEINPTDVYEYPEYNYIAWNQKKASEYHSPILRSFLDYYLN